jgi:hypothetical protein
VFSSSSVRHRRRLAHNDCRRRRRRHHGKNVVDGASLATAIAVAIAAVSCIVSLIGLLQSSIVVVVVDAFPTGAGACPGGEPAVGGIHTEVNPNTSGSLLDGSLTVRVDDIPVAGVSEGTATPATIQLTTNEVHTITVSGGPSGTFRGILIRGQVPITSGLSLEVSTDDSNMQSAASVCDVESTSTIMVEGITHVSNVDKTSVSGTIELFGGGIEDVTGRLDITVVIENVGGSSIYYYTGYDVMYTSSTEPDTGGGGGGGEFCWVRTAVAVVLRLC